MGTGGSMKKLVISMTLLIAVGVLSGFLVTKQTVSESSNLLDSDSFVFIAHRGASGHAPEHTIEAYKQAKDLGADYIEIDLQMTKDGHLVALHDETVDRTTDGTGKISEMTLEEIKKLDAGTWFNEENPDFAQESYKGEQIPTLKEIFEEFGHDVNYYIETKKPEGKGQMEKALVSLLDEYGFLEKSVDPSKVIIQSFSTESLLKVHELNDSIPLVQLQTQEQIEKMDSQEKFEEISDYAVGLGPYFKAIDMEYVKNAEKAGLLVHPFTPNEPVEISKLKSWGVNGVFTNYAESYVEALSME